MHSPFAAGWRQVGACLLLMAACSMITAGYSIVAVPLAGEFHPSRMVLMLAMTVMAGVSGLASPFLGGLMDRVSLRPLMILGSLALVAGYAALSFVTSFGQVLVIFGVLIAPANVLIGPIAATVLLSRWFVKRRGTAFGIAISGVALGSFAYPPLVQALLDSYDWRIALRLFAAILLFTTLPFAALIIDRPADRGLHPDGAASDPAAAHADKPAPKVPASVILSDPTFWMAAVLFALVLSGMAGMVTNLAPLAIEQGISPASAALLISIYAAGGFCAKMGFAFVADRISPRYLMFASLVGFAIGMVCLVDSGTGYWMIAAGVWLIGMFGGIMVPLQSFLTPRIFGAHVVGRAYGLMSLVLLCFMLSTPPVFGLVYDATGSYSPIFLTFALLAGAAMLIVPYIRLDARSAAGPLEAGDGPAPAPAESV